VDIRRVSWVLGVVQESEKMQERNLRKCIKAVRKARLNLRCSLWRNHERNLLSRPGLNYLLKSATEPHP